MIDWHKTVKFIKDDWNEHPIRVILEGINWALNLAVALLFALTVPDVPLITAYTLFLLALSISIWSAHSRGSFGLLMTSITIFIIDVVAYWRLLFV